MDLENLDTNLFPKPHLTLKPGHVVELYGTSCCTKTEVLYHLVAQCILPPNWRGVQLNGHNVGVVFVDTEYQFSMLRLFAIMESRVMERLEKVKSDQNDDDEEQSARTDLPTGDNVEGFIKTALSKLYVVRCSSSEQLVISLHSLESLLANHPEIGVLMLDSVSAFYWIDRTNAGDNANNQEAMQRRTTQILQRLMDEYQLVLIATKPAIVQRKHRGGGGYHHNNHQRQESSSSAGSPLVKKDSGSAYSPLNHSFTETSHGGGPEVIEHHEYMCHSWHQMVTFRFHLQRCDDVVDRTRQRSLYKAKLIHPSSIKHQVTFCVAESGVSYQHYGAH